MQSFLMIVPKRKAFWFPARLVCVGVCVCGAEGGVCCPRQFSGCERPPFSLGGDALPDDWSTPQPHREEVSLSLQRRHSSRASRLPRYAAPAGPLFALQPSGWEQLHCAKPAGPGSRARGKAGVRETTPLVFSYSRA